MKTKMMYISMTVFLVLISTGCFNNKPSDPDNSWNNRTTDQSEYNIEENQNSLPNLEENQNSTVNRDETIDSEKNQETLDENSSSFQLRPKENQLDDFVKLNSDFAGIIKIEDIIIDLPVVKGPDNEFYLKRDINKKQNYYGILFMDYRNFGAGFDKNIIIYGHNMKDNEMFGPLRNYMNQQFAQENTLITFQDLYTTRRYQVFSTYYTESDGDLITTSFTQESFEDYIEEIRSRSMVEMNIEVKNTDNIITLVTCNYDMDDGRYFVHAVEIDS